MTDFETWFSADYNRLLQTVEPDDTALSNGLGIQFASWDRRAAYLLWVAMGRPRAGWVEQTAALYSRRDVDFDLLGESEPETEDLFG